MWWNLKEGKGWCISVNDADTVADLRQRRDTFFASPQGPLSSEARATFQGLKYYPLDPAYKFTLEPTRRDTLEPLEILTSSGVVAWYLLWGHVTVNFETGPWSLELYVKEPEENPSSVFLPFKDTTNGSETYGGGRYLDAPLENGVLTLDFNLAYSPFCAYGEGWTCPLPPRANYLNVAIRAGEKLLEQLKPPITVPAP